MEVNASMHQLTCSICSRFANERGQARSQSDLQYYATPSNPPTIQSSSDCLPSSSSNQLPNLESAKITDTAEEYKQKLEYAHILLSLRIPRVHANNSAGNTSIQPNFSRNFPGTSANYSTDTIGMKPVLEASRQEVTLTTPNNNNNTANVLTRNLSFQPASEIRKLSSDDHAVQYVGKLIRSLAGRSSDPPTSKFKSVAELLKVETTIPRKRIAFQHAQTSHSTGEQEENPFMVYNVTVSGSIRIVRSIKGISAEGCDESGRCNGFFRQTEHSYCRFPCRMGCRDNLLLEDCMNVFEQYWSLPTEEGRSQWLADRMEVNPGRSNFFLPLYCKYFFYNIKNSRVYVCKRFFIAILDEKMDTVNRIEQELHNRSERQSNNLNG